MLKRVRIGVAGVLAGIMLFGSGLSLQAETVSADKISNPTHYCANGDEGKRDYSEWSYVYYGSYPQIEITDKKVTDAVDAALQDSGKTMGDVWIGNKKYRRISQSDTKNESYFGNEKYRYFEWKRIKWKVLDAGENLVLMTDKAIDSVPFAEEEEPISWRSSEVRSFLNAYNAYSNQYRIDYSVSGFLNQAFTSEEQESLKTVNVMPENNPEDNTTSGSSTIDKVYLLSISEASNAEYGFCPDRTWKSESRGIFSTDYSYVKGAWKRNQEDYVRCWLRTSYNVGYNASVFYNDGTVSCMGYPTTFRYNGVMPVICVNKNDKNILLEDDGTSGKGGNGASVIYQNGMHIHKEVSIPAVAAKCTTKGKTAGKKCSICGKVIVAQKDIPALTHDFGKNEQKCKRCGAKNPNYKPAAQKKQTISTAKIKSYKASFLKKKTVSFSLKAKASGKTKLTYKVTSYPKNSKKYITVSKNGKVTLKKGAKKGTYKIMIKAAASSKYKAASKTVVIKVK